MNKYNSILYTIEYFLSNINFYKKNKSRLYYNYVYYVLHNRFIPYETIIAKNPNYAYWYARTIIMGKFPKAERTIAKNPKYACWYAKDIIEDRFPAGEKTIFNSKFKFDYEKNILKELGLTWRDLGYE